MSQSFNLENFAFGLDTRRSELTSKPGVLQTLQNAHINQGAEIEKRKAFVPLYLPGTSFGGLAGTNIIYIFGSSSGTQASGVLYVTNIQSKSNGLTDIEGFYTGSWTNFTGTLTLSGFTNPKYDGHYTIFSQVASGGSFDIELNGANQPYDSVPIQGQGTLGCLFPGTFATNLFFQTLIHPDGSTAMTGMVSATLFAGLPFVAAKFADGNVYCYYNGSLVADFTNGLVAAWVNTDNQIAAEIAQLINETASSLVSGEPIYTAVVSNNQVTVQSTPTNNSGTPFTATVDTILESLSTGGITANQISAGYPNIPPNPAQGNFAIVAGVNSTQATGSAALGVNPSNGDTLTIENQVYTFVNAINNTISNQIKIGANGNATASNLNAAIIGGSGAGLSYSEPTVANSSVSSMVSTNTVTLTALDGGAIGNSITLSTTSLGISLSGATLSGGVDVNYFTNVNVGSTNLLSGHVSYARSAQQTAINIAANINANTNSNGGFTATASGGVVYITCPINGPAQFNGLVVETIIVGQVIIQQISFTVDIIANGNTITSIVVGATTITSGTITSGGSNINTWAAAIVANIVAFSGTSLYTAVNPPNTSIVYISPLTSLSNSTPGTTVMTYTGGTYVGGTGSPLSVVLSTYSLVASSGSPPVTSGPCTALAAGGTPPYSYQWNFVSGTQFFVTNPTSPTTQWQLTTPGSFTGNYTCTVTDSAGPPNVFTSPQISIKLTTL